ncbi:hypothetical protein N2152v2_006949 [Parachlorella kessleri]
MSNQLLRGDLLDPKDDPTAGASAKLPHAKPHGMKAQIVHSEGLEYPVPTAVERELQTSLHGDPTQKFNHPGIPCSQLPHGHAHPLPPYESAARRQATIEDLDEARRELMQGPIVED